MFSVYAGNARSSRLVVGAVTSSSTHAGLQHWNFGHRNCCASVERSISWRRLNVADGDQCPPQVGCRLLGMLVSDPLATGAPDMHHNSYNCGSWSHFRTSRRLIVICKNAYISDFYYGPGNLIPSITTTSKRVYVELTLKEKRVEMMLKSVRQLRCSDWEVGRVNHCHRTDNYIFLVLWYSRISFFIIL